PKLFHSELLGKKKVLEEEIKKIDLRGSFDGKPQPEDLETYKALKEQLRQVRTEITGVDVTAGSKRKLAYNPRNEGMAPGQEARTERVVDEIARRNRQPLTEYKVPEHIQKRESAKEQPQLDPVAAAEMMRKAREDAGLPPRK